ncbi:MAG: hypothetical protein HGGPFJEG_01150 [Ignavibacteria bacterium]|nr:hypothetical protein [Ignavibacteria bacterium]
MKQRESKFERIYRFLSVKEKKEFRELTKNTLLKRGRNYIKILDEIDNGSIIFKSKIKSRSKWNRLSELYLLSEKYLAFKQLEQNKHWLEYFAVKEMLNRDAHNIMEMKVRYWRKKNLKHKASLEEFKLVKYQMELDLSYLSKIGDGESYGSVFTEYARLCFLINMIEISGNLIDDWKLAITKTIPEYSCMRNLFAFFNFEEALKFIKSDFPESYHPVEFNYLVFLSLCNPLDSDSFFKAMSLLNNELSKIKDSRRLDWYLNLLNASINRVNHGIKGAVEDQFNLIKSKVNEALIDDLKNKYILGNHFRDYILTACKLYKFDWAENFILSYSDYLPEDGRKEITLICKAWIKFYKGNFENCLCILEDFCFTNPLLYVDAARMKLICFYESENLDKCTSLLHSFIQYLRRPHTVQDELLKNSKNFCRNFSRLLKYSDNPDWTEVKFLLSELEKNYPNGEKWLKKKTREILQQYS